MSQYRHKGTGRHINIHPVDSALGSDYIALFIPFIIFIDQFLGLYHLCRHDPPSIRFIVISVSCRIPASLPTDIRIVCHLSGLPGFTGFYCTASRGILQYRNRIQYLSVLPRYRMLNSQSQSQLQKNSRSRQALSSKHPARSGRGLTIINISFHCVFING